MKYNLITRDQSKHPSQYLRYIFRSRSSLGVLHFKVLVTNTNNWPLIMGLNENGEYILKELRKPPTRQWRKYIGVMKVLLLILVFFVGFVIGYFAVVGLSNKDECSKIKEGEAMYVHNPFHGFEKYHEKLLKSLSAKNIESFSRFVFINIFCVC